jgi:hypothetical protein
LQNGGGISAGNYFSTDKFMDRVHVSVDRPGVLGPPRTDGGMDRGGAGARWRAHRSSAFYRGRGSAKARRRGRKRERGARGAQLEPHRSSGGAVEAGRRWCRTGRWRRSVRHYSGVERGKKKRGKVWCYSGMLAFYGGGGSVGKEMPVGNDRGFTADAIDGRGGC